MPNGAHDKNDGMFVRSTEHEMARKEQEKKPKTKDRVYIEWDTWVASVFVNLHLSSFNEAMPLNLSHTNSNKHLEVESNKFLKLFILL